MAGAAVRTRPPPLRVPRRLRLDRTARSGSKTSHRARVAWASARLCGHGWVWGSVAAVVAGALAAGAVVVGAVAVEAEGGDADAAGVASRSGGPGGEQEPPCESAATWRAPSPMDTLGADSPWPMDGIDRPALLQSPRFNVVRLLGQGAFGRVYLVNDRSGGSSSRPRCLTPTTAACGPTACARLPTCGSVCTRTSSPRTGPRSTAHLCTCSRRRWSTTSARLATVPPHRRSGAASLEGSHVAWPTSTGCP